MHTELWKLHEAGKYFISCGGNLTAPPHFCNLILTDKCNLSCTICGSQARRRESSTPRSHMPLETFQGVAKTLFPFIYSVELNSAGDPLMYPHIREVINSIVEHKCNMRLQTNGTLFTQEIVESLVQVHGEISLSIDATGEIFEQVRRNALWDDTCQSINTLIRHVDRSRQYLSLYPTVSARTMGDMLKLAQWASELGIDHIAFHDFQPNPWATEKRPDPEGVKTQCQRIASWITQSGIAMGVSCNGLSIAKATEHKRPAASPEKQRHITQLYPNYPVAKGHPRYLCAAPLQSLDIGMDGQVSPCCRSQRVPMGLALSVEQFADTWFGDSYVKLRKSLEREGEHILSLPECVPCIATYVPKLASSFAQAVRYKNGQDKDHASAFKINDKTVPVTVVLRDETSPNLYFGHIGYGLDPQSYVLLENNRKLNPDSYEIKGELVYFTPSDTTNAVKNGRTYTLRRISDGSL